MYYKAFVAASQVNMSRSYFTPKNQKEKKKIEEKWNLFLGPFCDIIYNYAQIPICFFIII